MNYQRTHRGETFESGAWITPTTEHTITCFSACATSGLNEAQNISCLSWIKYTYCMPICTWRLRRGWICISLWLNSHAFNRKSWFWYYFMIRPMHTWPNYGGHHRAGFSNSIVGKPSTVMQTENQHQVGGKPMQQQQTGGKTTHVGRCL